MTLYVCTWLWGNKYDKSYVSRLRASVTRNMVTSFFWAVFEPEPEDMHLTTIPGCFARLRMFDPAWQARLGLRSSDRLVCLDLDTVITGRLDELFDRADPFCILQGANAANPCPFNGSVMMLRGGYRPDVWANFSPEAARKVPFYEFPDDQGWLWHKLPDAAGWKAGPGSGIYAFQKPGWPQGSTDLPSPARMVVFPGRRDPAQFAHLPWVKAHWR